MPFCPVDPRHRSAPVRGPRARVVRRADGGVVPPVIEHALAHGPRPDAVIATGDIGDDYTAARTSGSARRSNRAGVPVYCCRPATTTTRRDGVAARRPRRAVLRSRPARRLGPRVRGPTCRAVLRASPGRPRSASTPTSSGFSDVPGAGVPAPPAVRGRKPLARRGRPAERRRGARGAGPASAGARRDRGPRAPGHDRRRRVRMLTTPSTCAQFTPQTEQCVMDSAPGYRRLTLAGTTDRSARVEWLPGRWAAPRGADGRR